ncbi:Alpha/Beta hydrolase protein [Gautieria morchelliformis]|nr:Alpha/Beta hydrolase protein [Gautieria morchelliformis]
MAAVLASQPGDACCNNTIFDHTAVPQGSTVTVANLETYISGSKSNSDKIVLFFPDIHGPFHHNNKLIADHFASNGFLVIAPDYFEGNPVQVVSERPGFDMYAWFDTSLARARVITPKWIDTVMEEYGNAKTQYSTVGYCFGAPFVCDLLATDRVKSGAIAHPAFLDEDHFRKLTKPLLLSCAEVDLTFPNKPRHTAEDILAEIKATYHFQLFSGVEHGFALRGNMENENERWAKEQSAKGIVSWWNRFIKVE